VILCREKHSGCIQAKLNNDTGYLIEQTKSNFEPERRRQHACISYAGSFDSIADPIPLGMMSEIQPPIIAPQDDGSGIVPEHEPPEPAPITEEEVGDYREQDRFLPVRFF
jgi:hypothetical protein